MGKRRTEIKEIQEKDRKQVTFSKRRKGLFKKAAELSLLTGAQVAIFAFSPGGKIFTCDRPSVDAAVDAYLGGSTGSISGTTRCCDEEAELIKTNIRDLQRQIEIEKAKNRVVEELKMNSRVCEASAACDKSASQDDMYDDLELLNGEFDVPPLLNMQQVRHCCYCSS